MCLLFDQNLSKFGIPHQKSSQPLILQLVDTLDTRYNAWLRIRHIVNEIIFRKIPLIDFENFS